MTGPLTQIWCEGSLVLAVTSPQIEAWASQKAWSEALDDVSSSWLESEVSCRLSTLKRLQSGAHSSAWLVSLPLERHCISAFSPTEWRALLRFRCGVPLMPRARCGGCDAAMDTFGDHALSCASCGRYARHNRLRQAVAFEYEQAGQAFRLEVEGCCPAPRTSLRWSQRRLPPLRLMCRWSTLCAPLQLSLPQQR